MYPKKHVTRRISLRMQQLDMFLSLLETASIRATAEKMSLTQSAVSKSLKELEMSLETTLFERTPAGLQPTPQSKFLTRYSRNVINGFNSLWDDLRHSESHLSGEQLHIGATLGGPSILLMQLMEQPLAQSTGSARICAQSGSNSDLRNALLMGKLDIAIAHASNSDIANEISALPVGQDEIIAVARPSHPVFSNLSRYQEFTWAMPQHDDPLRQWLDQKIDAYGLSHSNAILECSSTQEAAISNDLVAWTTHAAAESWIERGDLKRLDLPFASPSLTYFAMRVRKRILPTMGSMLWLEIAQNIRKRRRFQRCLDANILPS